MKLSGSFSPNGALDGGIAKVLDGVDGESAERQLARDSAQALTLACVAPGQVRKCPLSMRLMLPALNRKWRVRPNSLRPQTRKTGPAAGARASGVEACATGHFMNQINLKKKPRKRGFFAQRIATTSYCAGGCADFELSVSTICIGSAATGERGGRERPRFTGSSVTYAVGAPPDFVSIICNPTSPGNA